MSYARNKKYLSLFAATFLLFAGVLFFGNTEQVHAASWGWFGKTWDAVTNPIDTVLAGVLGLTGIFLSLSLTFFSWTINVGTVRAILTAEEIYDVWMFVRDLCNIAFILILVFSAFATIFQVDKYNYKKILLWLVIMALLVNFSYPITLFVIDISNSLMYTLLDYAFRDNPIPPGGSPASALVTAHGSPFQAIKEYVDNADGHSESKALFFMIIFVFILACTMLALGLILLIRTIALAIIIIFSPIGFVGTIIGKDGDWWKNLFKYAMAGPIIALVLAIAIRLMAVTVNAPRFTDDLPGEEGGILASASSFIVPIVILWMGMGMAIKGIDGAGAVMGKVRGGGVNMAKKFGKRTWNSTGIPGGVKQAWNKNVSQKFARSQQNREAWVAGKLKDTSAGERNMKARASQYDKDNESIEDLEKWADAGDSAAVYALANKGKIKKEKFAGYMEKIHDPKVRKAILGKTEETRMDATIEYRYEEEKAKAKAENRTAKSRTVVMKEAYGGLNAEGWAKQKDLDKQFENTELKAAAHLAFNSLSDEAKTEAFKRMNGTNSSALPDTRGRRTA